MNGSRGSFAVHLASPSIRTLRSRWTRNSTRGSSSNLVCSHTYTQLADVEERKRKICIAHCFLPHHFPLYHPLLFASYRLLISYLPPYICLFPRFACPVSTMFICADRCFSPSFVFIASFSTFFVHIVLVHVYRQALYSELVQIITLLLATKIITAHRAGVQPLLPTCHPCLRRPNRHPRGRR